MNREDIIRMARETGCWETDTGELVTDEIQLERFAALVASAERKEILDFSNSEAFNRQNGERSPYAYELANAILARGQS